jgi:small subunit ribosomal protein S13e
LALLGLPIRTHTHTCPFLSSLSFLTSLVRVEVKKIWHETYHNTSFAPVNNHSMGRLHAPGKGISKSARPYKRTPPSWLKISAADVEEHVCKLAKKGLTPSAIGVILRDSNGIAQVKSVTGQKIVRILKANGLAPEIPEDLYMLIKKAVQVRKHLEKNRKDKDSKFRLILIESRIHRLARYYRTTRKLPANWKYESATASTMVA